MGRREGVKLQYETWPYPHYPFFASVRRADTWQLNLDYLFDRCGSGIPPENPRIWIAGCGTFQPYTVGLANPEAEIWATDNSRPSLRVARRRCAWHGIGNVQFAQIDLNDPTTWPEGAFDYIECYGVLMNLEDPTSTLQAMAERLTERGVLRIMVYPQFSRQRIFQIQRVAKLLGLDFREPKHPRMLAKVMTSLPAGHPLRFAFETYPDSTNDAGIVDGFLHAGDRGFTGLELGGLIEEANLDAAFWFHRPWGQPEVRAHELDLTDQHPAAILDYLDRWQELRTNFILCMRRADAPYVESSPLRLHPHLDAWRRRIPMIARLRTLAHSILGIKLPTRTHAADLRWSRQDLAILRRSARGRRLGEAEQTVVNRGRSEGLLLGGPARTRSVLPTRLPPTPPAPRSLYVGEQVPNPLYQHLLAAWHKDGAEQRWRDHAEPLENPGQFGLTPYGTWLAHPALIERHLRRCRSTTVDSYAELRYDDEAAGRLRLERFLAHFPGLPDRERTAAEERELFILLGTHERLLLNCSRVSADTANSQAESELANSVTDTVSQ